MTEIKCRYFQPYCDSHDYEYEKNMQYYSGFWFCDDNSNCDGYKRPENADPKCSNPVCRFSKDKYIEFSKYVKSYTFVNPEDRDSLELSGGYLIIGKTKIDVDDISYLEIDGRIIINEEVNND